MAGCSTLRILCPCCRFSVHNSGLLQNLCPLSGVQFMAGYCSLLQVMAGCCSLLQVMAGSCRLWQVVAAVAACPVYPLQPAIPAIYSSLIIPLIIKIGLSIGKGYKGKPLDQGLFCWYRSPRGSPVHTPVPCRDCSLQVWQVYLQNITPRSGSLKGAIPVHAPECADHRRRMRRHRKDGTERICTRSGSLKGAITPFIGFFPSRGSPRRSPDQYHHAAEGSTSPPRRHHLPKADITLRSKTSLRKSARGKGKRLSMSVLSRGKEPRHSSPSDQYHHLPQANITGKAASPAEGRHRSAKRPVEGENASPGR